MLDCVADCCEETLAMQLLTGLLHEYKATFSTRTIKMIAMGEFDVDPHSGQGEGAAQGRQQRRSVFSAESLERESLREAAEATPGEKPGSRPRAAAQRATTATRRATGRARVSPSSSRTPRASSSTTNRGWSESWGWRRSRDSRGGCLACD